jgi:hypothetical protein
MTNLSTQNKVTRRNGANLSGASHAKGVADGNSTAIHIHLGMINAKDISAPERNNSKCLIEFPKWKMNQEESSFVIVPEIDIRDFQTMTREQFRNRNCGSNAHFIRCTSTNSKPNKGTKRLKSYQSNKMRKGLPQLDSDGPLRSADFSSIRRQADAPSESCEAFPAVIVAEGSASKRTGTKPETSDNFVPGRLH